MLPHAKICKKTNTKREKRRKVSVFRKKIVTLCPIFNKVERPLKKIKHIINTVLWTLVALYAALVVLLHLPPVQAFVGSEVATLLGRKLGTRVTVGSVNLGFFNRVIVDNVSLLDQRGDSLLYAARASVKMDVVPLFRGRISISSAQLFGLRARLYRQTAQSQPNFQFVLDSLASKDTTRHTPLDLHIGSLIVRHGDVAYDQRDVASRPGVFSPRHLHVTDLSTHILLDRLTDDRIAVMVKRLSLHERSGLDLRSLHLRLTADRTGARLEEFDLQLPHSDLSLGDITASYRMKADGKKLDLSTLEYKGSIRQSKITLSDIACFVPALNRFDDAVYASARFSGTGNSLHCSSLNFRTGSGSINLQASGRLSDWQHRLRWNASIDNLNLSADGIAFVADNLGKQITVPQQVLRLGTIHYTGTLGGIRLDDLRSRGELQTDAGSARIEAQKHGEYLQAKVDTRDIDLGRILDNDQLGLLATTIDVRGTRSDLHAKGTVSRFDFGGYNFHDITLDAGLSHDALEGQIAIDDDNAKLQASGDYNLKTKRFAVDATLQHLLPAILGVKMHDPSYSINDVHLSANNKTEDSYLDVEAPFANLHARGNYDLTTVWQSLGGALADHLPTLPGLPQRAQGSKNDFTLQANVNSTEPLRRFFGLQVDLSSPLHIAGNVSDPDRQLSLYVTLPGFSLNGKPYHGGNIEVNGDSQALTADVRLAQGLPYETAPLYHVNARAAENVLTTLVDYDNRSAKLPVQGRLNAQTQFSTLAGALAAHVKVNPSEFKLGGARWDVHPAEINYSKNSLAVDHFSISHGAQHVSINGRATPQPGDSIVADLKDVDVAYIMDLINFHSVDFTGLATGQAVVKSLFKNPDAYARLDIGQFTFEGGALGTLHAAVDYNKKDEQIDILATADDGPGHQTYIDGYVSPKRNYIDLGIKAQGTSVKFMETYCGSFMDNIQAWADGDLHIVGDLSNINLVGDIDAYGSIHMRQLGTDYTFEHVRGHAVPDDILLENDTLYDREHHAAVISGGIHHKHLTRLSFDLDVKAQNFLGYDTHEFGDNTFYGTVYATGEVGIHGKSGETVIDIDASPAPGSLFVYNAASTDAVAGSSFIHWHDVTQQWQNPYLTPTEEEKEQDKPAFSSDMRINFLVNATPDLTVRLLMDPQSGDYIDLHGNGTIRAAYFDKGGLDMFGNYVVSSGLYKLTIQNLIKKDFAFQPGGTISFGGNPYSAPLNLQAKYVLNGVPLSDLNIGRSFSSNNIRVECLMDITGTPGAPKVDFSLNLPTVNSDARQMIYSLLNSQEEMNQQVLYLLAVGRFLPQSKNNQSADGTQQSQTSLAMQSFISGTVSQQLNNVLSGVVKNQNWNFGANISTGDEGFYNAEYEGILSGKMLNNRLLFNGQFGYRDKAGSTQSFIGDFDLRYLIYPNGNLAIRMYNQSNDRYFTRNTLNTQGIGLILKKDFTTLGDLFGIKKKKKKQRPASSN